MKEQGRVEERITETLRKNSVKSKEKDNDIKEIDSYKPSGQLIYNNEIISSFKNNIIRRYR